MQRPTRSNCSSLTLPALAALAVIGCASVSPAAATTPAVPSVAQSSPSATVRLGVAPEHAYPHEFFPGTTYDSAISTPDAVLGFRLGDQPASHAQVLACWRTWARESRRVQLATYAHSHEGRELVFGVVTSERNLANLDAILERIQKLADPRKLVAGELEGIVADTPAVAWLGYSIHGDEMSGVDGGLAFAHHLIAGTSSDVARILDRVVVVIDPIQNPDGRERFLAMLLANSGATAVLDGEALSHGRWPGGRGNHYLFDMNRDWLSGIAPETRGRWKVVQRFRPQLFVDAHEMGRDDSYLFYPQADPINPHLPRKLVEWQMRYAADIAKAFDAHGWSYYTREWADGWGPFYSDSWGSLNGAIGILYEQARYNGQTVRLESGEIATYREAAHHQATASVANVTTLSQRTESALRDFHEHRLRALESTDERRYVVISASTNRARDAQLIGTLVEQGVEVFAGGALTLSNALDTFGVVQPSLEVHGDAWVIDANQPQGALVRAFLELDTRYPRADLERERRELELKGNSKIYDVTAWNLLHANDAEAWWCTSYATERALSGPLADASRSAGQVVSAVDAAAPIYAWLVDGDDDASVVFAARAMQLGLKLNFADEDFESAGRKFARGSLLVRRHENPANSVELIERAAFAAGVHVFAASSARAPGVGHDLGGQHFHLLELPRIAMLSNAPISSQAFGHLWHHLDRELGLPVSLLDAQQLGDYDLRRYNVLVLPPSGGLMDELAPVAERLQAWVQSGGTLIATGSSAGVLAKESLGLSSVRERGDVLEKLDDVRFIARRERLAGRAELDERAIWEGVPTDSSDGTTPPSNTEQDDDAAEDDHKRTDDNVDPDQRREETWRRRFSPQGVFLRGNVRAEHWLTCGADAEMPLHFDGSLSLWPNDPSTAVVRLATSERLRLSGLLWPEARERLAESAYLTVESTGHGQVILFAALPGFRGYHAATARLFANAVVFGPGVGADPSRER